MKLLDRYILRNFLGTYFYVLFLIMLIAIVFDFSEKVEDFLTKGASLREIIMDYYVNFFVFYGNMFSMLIVFVSTIVFTSRLTMRTEIVAILTTGTSFRRLMMPYLLGSTVIFAINLGMSHYVIPETNITRINFENTYINSKKERRQNNIFRQIAPGEIVFLENFNMSRNSGYNLTFEKFDHGRLTYKLKGDFVTFDSLDGKWVLNNWNERIIHKDGTETMRNGRQMDTVINFTPEELSPLLFTTSMMKTPELNEFIASEKLRGSSNINFYEVEKYRRTAFPVATYILVLIAVSLSTKKRRGGLGINVALGILLCLVYVFLMQVSTTFSTHSNMDPLLAVWLPNLMFATVGLYLYLIAPK